MRCSQGARVTTVVFTDVQSFERGNCTELIQSFSQRTCSCIANPTHAEIQCLQRGNLNQRVGQKLSAFCSDSNVARAKHGVQAAKSTTWSRSLLLIASTISYSIILGSNHGEPQFISRTVAICKFCVKRKIENFDKFVVAFRLRMLSSSHPSFFFSAQSDFFRACSGLVDGFEPNISNYRKLYPRGSMPASLDLDEPASASASASAPAAHKSPNGPAAAVSQVHCNVPSFLQVCCINVDSSRRTHFLKSLSSISNSAF